MIPRLARWIILVAGWRRAIIACLAGAASALAMPPFGMFPILAITLPVLILLIDGAGAGGRLATALAAARIGWFFGFGYHLAGLWWVGSAFLVNADAFAWLMPIAVMLLPAGLALFTALGTGLARLAWQPDAGRIIALAVGLTIADLARGHLFTGFPWNLFGYALTQQLWLAQAASLVGAYGLTFIAVLVLSTPVVLADDAKERARRVGWPIGGALALVCLALLGGWRVSTTEIAMVDGVRLRVVQPDIPQDDRFRPEARDWIVERYLEMSDRATSPSRMGVRDVTHLIWPESAFPFFLIQDRETLARIAAFLPAGTTLITGAARPEWPAPGQRNPRVFNSVYVIDHEGAIVATYDKVHLVPFGEYLPFHEALESLGLEALTRVRGGFSAGDRRRTFSLPGAPPVGFLICYEVIFPGAATAADRRPAWLINVTNDAWFGYTPGPWQHHHQTVVRAIEEGLPIVRAANNGISGVIDPLGRSVRMAGLGARDVLDSPLPRALPKTIYATFGDILSLIILLILFVFLVRRAGK